MNKLFTKIAAAFVGMAMAIGVGVAVGNNGVKEAKATTSTAIIVDGDDLGLTNTATTGATSVLYSNVEYIISDGAKLQSKSGNNAFQGMGDNAILIGKSGKNIHNSTKFFGNITKFEIFSNGGGSEKVSVGVNFSSSTIDSYNANASNTYKATLSTNNQVYDCSSNLATNTRYFWYQVTNSNNSQVAFRITYDKKAISSLSYTGTLNKTGYNVGEKFNPSGLTFTANSSDGNEEISGSAISWPDLSVGDTSITGSFLGSSITVTGITVSAPKNLTVTYNANGADFGSVPTDSNSPYANTDEVTVLGNTGSLVKSGYRFGGWNTEHDDTGTTYLPSETFNISTSTTLYARWLNNNQITFSDKTLGLENAVQYSDPFETNLFSIQFAGGGNDGKYYTSGSGIKTYSNGTISISINDSLTTKELTSILFVWSTAPTAANFESASVGKYDISNCSWSGHAKNVVLTRSSTTGDPNSWQLKSVTVSLSDIAASEVSIALSNNSTSTLSDGVINIEKDDVNFVYTEYLVASVGPNNAADRTVTWSADGDDPSAADIAHATINDANNTIEFEIDISEVASFTIVASADGGVDVTAFITFNIIDSSASPLTGVTVSEDPTYPTQYDGNEFKPDGLTFTANHEDSSVDAVIDAGDIIWNTLVANQNPSGSYTENGVTVTVTVTTVSVLENTLTVTIGGAMTKTTYAVEDSWDKAGLTASGTYADSSSYSGSFEWSFSPATPLEMYDSGNARTLTVTAMASDGTLGTKQVTITLSNPSNGTLIDIENEDITNLTGGADNSYASYNGTRTIDGFSIKTSDVMKALNNANYPNGIQFKGSSGKLFNTTIFTSGVKMIKISNPNAALNVKFSASKNGDSFDDMEVSSKDAVSVGGSTYYIPNGNGTYRYFAIAKTNSGAAYCDKIEVLQFQMPLKNSPKPI